MQWPLSNVAVTHGTEHGHRTQNTETQALNSQTEIPMHTHKSINATKCYGVRLKPSEVFFRRFQTITSVLVASGIENILGGLVS